jgi:outer membrane lipopolysaccharide assembly protein LptE/RlpB
LFVKTKIQGSNSNSIQVARISVLALIIAFILSGCGIYKFNQVSIPPDIKTVRVQFIRNEARYQGNTQLSPQLTDKLRQKIVSQTKLTQVNKDDADYDISGYVSQYDVSTSGITAQQVATNRLTVAVSITLLDRKTPNKEPKNFTVSRSFDFSANLTLPQAEQKLNEEMIRNLVDEIFNQIFSGWEE